MQNHFVKYGFMMGLAAVILNVLLYLYDTRLLLGIGSWIALLVYIYFMVKTVMSTRSENGGYLSLKDAFKSAWLSFVLGSFISSIFMFILVNYIDPTLIDTIKTEQINVLNKAAPLLNLSEKQLTDQIETIRDTNPFGLAQIALSIPFSFLFPGAVLAMIIAAILKKNDPSQMKV